MPEYSDAEIMEIKKEALEEGKLSFKEVLDAVARNRTTPSFGYCKKPDKFRLGQDDITRYIDRWDAYRRIVNITDPLVTRIFLTFLDDVSLNKLLDNLDSAQKDSWEVARPLIIKLLEPPYLRFQAKAKLVRAIQIRNESVEEFIMRITELGRQAFNDNEKMIRDRLILDTFLAGLRSRQIAMMLYSKLGLEMTLEAAIAEAMNLEIAVKSRNIVHGEDSEVDMQDGQVLAIHAGPSRGFSGSRGHEEQNLDYWADSQVMENDKGSESSSSDF